MTSALIKSIGALTPRALNWEHSDFAAGEAVYCDQVGRRSTPRCERHRMRRTSPRRAASVPW